MALEQIEGALIDPEIVPLKRAELAIKWLTLLKENMQKIVEQRPVKRQLDPDTIRLVLKEVYGYEDKPPADDPELPNGGVKNMEVPGRN